MKCKLQLLIIVILLIMQKIEAQELKLWYNSPAQYFINALPVGNGRLAAMDYGRPQEELIHLNEETLWSGGPINLNPNPGSPQYLAPLRKALDEDNYDLAEQLSMKLEGHFTQ